MILIIAVLALSSLVWYLWWNRSALHLSRAHQEFRRGNEAGALVCLEKAEAAGRLSAEATTSFAYLLLKHGRTDEADSLLSRALSLGRRSKALKAAERRLVLTYRSIVLWKQDRMAEAVILLEDLLAQGYRTTSLYGNLGYFLIESGNLERAEELCLEAAEWGPDGKVILDNLGSLWLKKGQWEAANEVYTTLVALDPKFPEAWWGAGLALSKLGKKDQALESWQKALTLPFNALTTVSKASIEAASEALR